MNPEELFRLAVKARENAYCPYSGFAVGAALLCKDGSIYTGCNIENAAFGPGNCAERTAIFTAVACGRKDFEMIAVAGGKVGENITTCYPCGVCRQVMAEFSVPDEFYIICGEDEKHLTVKTLSELLPYSFGL